MVRPRILVVDDHESVRSLIRDILESEPGWEVCGEAADGEEAIAAATALLPDIVLMDFMMPKRNGLDATREIVRAMPQAIVLLVSLYAFPELSRQAQEAGALGCILKPESSRMLVPAIRSLIDRRPYFPSANETPT